MEAKNEVYINWREKNRYLLKVLIIILWTMIILVNDIPSSKRTDTTKSSTSTKALRHFFAQKNIQSDIIAPIWHQRVFPAEYHKQSGYANYLLLLGCSKRSIERKIYKFKHYKKIELILELVESPLQYYHNFMENSFNLSGSTCEIQQYVK